MEGFLSSSEEGLEMTLPGIYAEESAKRGGEVLKIEYPWDDERVYIFQIDEIAKELTE